MVYTKRKNNRIQDPNQIKYVKSILEASAQQCQQGGMYAPEIYIATAQRIADTYSLQDSNYPRITFNSKEQKLKGQENSVQRISRWQARCDREMADLISSFDGDLDQLNNRLKPHKLQINLSEDRQWLSVSEIDNGMAFSVFEAQVDSEGSKVTSEINDSAKLDILERFVEAEGEVLANITAHPEKGSEQEKATKEEPSLFL